MSNSFTYKGDSLINRVQKLVTEPIDKENRLSLIMSNLMINHFSRNILEKIIKKESENYKKKKKSKEWIHVMAIQ